MVKAVSTAKVTRDGVVYDLTSWLDRAQYQPPSGDMGSVIGEARVSFSDVDGTIPIVPRQGDEIDLYDALSALVFGGWIANPITTLLGPGTRSWTLGCQPWSARLAETSTGSLNKSGVVDSDRNFLIAMIRDCLKAQLFGADTTGTDDPIVTANEPDWPLVQGTTVMTGTDWSYRQGLDVVQDLLNRVPGAAIRIRADKMVEFGVLLNDAPFALVAVNAIPNMTPGAYAEIQDRGYQEEWLTAGHYNRVRLGGTGAAEAIATDESSYAKYGRVRNAPYLNDEGIGAGDLVRAAYARLASFAEREVVRLTVVDADGLEPGMRVPIIVPDLGTVDDIGWMPDTGWSWSVGLGTPWEEPGPGWRGEFIIQKVRPAWIAPGVQGYELELGSYQPDFDQALAASIGQTG